MKNVKRELIKVSAKNNKLFCFVMILIKETFIKVKMLIEVRGVTFKGDTNIETRKDIQWK